MALSHFNHPPDRVNQMASVAYSSPAYPDTTYDLQHYYHQGPTVGHSYSAEPSYMPDTARSDWLTEPASAYPSISTDAASTYASSSSSHAMSYPSTYASSSSSRSYAASFSPISASAAPALPTLQRASWAAGNAPSSALYVVEPEPDVQEPEAYPQVKTEEEEVESGFIFELASDTLCTSALNPLLVSMPEVPLRATQASKEMRKLMGAFRLDPFAMHNGVKSAASQSVPLGIEVGPLREPPVMFEWQVHLDYPLVPGTPSPRWAPHDLHAFEDDEEKWAPAGALEYPDEIYDEDVEADMGFQTVATPAQIVDWAYGDQQQSIGPAAGYPVQPLSGMFNRSSQSSSTQNMSRSLPPLSHSQPSMFYRQGHNQALSPPSTSLSSPSLSLPSPPHSHSGYSQRSTPVNASSTMYYRQQHSQAGPSSASAAMRVSALMSASTSSTPPRYQQQQQQQQEYAQPAYSSASAASSTGSSSGRYRDDSLSWYRRSLALAEAYTASACT